ncbi:energy transducer TonB [Psychroflexus sp. YR1-1]|uniref:Energy transducer TonB n=1 Tax=Psychroflexus aurantiacus TaxID=2709310 RepID=A0A6B3R5Y0_9FLAO|nr:energy transducer TonB [Psychroflexus aurantiacus]NEV92834.1 energy transducer TonB [Psychroflexus aurantiacus]
MKIKKNPKKDLSRYSLIFFQIGLILSLSISLIMIERKTLKKESADIEFVNFNVIEKEAAPLTEIKNSPPPPPALPAPAPESIKIVDNDLDIQEVNIQSTETSQDENVSVKSVSETGDVIGVEEVEDVEEEIEDVPFSVIEIVPVFPGCEGLKSNEKRKECMNRKVNEFVHEKFDMDIASDLKLSGTHRVFMSFKIDHTGSIVDIAARAPHPKLEAEGIRVIKMLPEMKPGEQRGRPVGVLFSLSIIIKIIE